MRVLISAFGFSPYRGSECAVGWNIARELAKQYEVTVIFGDVWGDCLSRQDLQKYTGQPGDDFQVDGMRAIYVPPSKFVGFITRLHTLPGCSLIYYLAYNLWQRAAFRVAKRLHGEQPFDVVHQLNMIGYREPGYLWKLNAPFFWGPVGGGPNEPFAYLRMFSWSGRARVFVRAVLNEIQKRINIRARKAARIAKHVWAVTDADWKMIRGIWGIECERMVETGTVLRDEGRVHSWDGREPLRVVWSGIHESRKALPILIWALAKTIKGGSRRVVVDILGEGSETANWRRLAEKAGVADCLIWHGKLPREEALKVMNKGHVFAFPSLKEGTPHVVLEAISLGLPVICHDACGMGTVVDESCGIKVSMRDPASSIEGFVAAIERLIIHPELIEKLSSGALTRVKSLTWEEKAANISCAYIKNGGRA